MSSSHSTFAADWFGWQGTPYHIGFWTDYSLGTVRGYLLTLPAGNARVLLAFLAVFVSISVSQLWSITCFIFHQVFSDDHAQDGLYHQRQAVLRNAGNPFSTLLYLFNLSWAWKSKADNPWRRQAIVIYLAIAHILLLSAASVLTAYVAIPGTHGEVLLSGEDICDWWWAASDDTSLSNWWGIERPILQQSALYARRCYLSDLASSQNSPACKTYSTPKILFEITTGVECPFPDRALCKNSTEGPVHLESEIINSNAHLGINAPSKDQVNYRWSMTCTPIADTPDTPFVTDNSTTVQLPTGHTVTASNRRFLYGPYDRNIENNLTTIGLYFDYVSSYYLGLPPYSLLEELALSNDPSDSSFFPLPELQPVSADLSIVILSKNIWYLEPFNDTIFGAQTREELNGTYWAPQRFSVIGCAQRHQFCNAANDKCTASAGWLDIGKSTDGNLRFKLKDDLGLSNLQGETITLIRQAAGGGQFNHVIFALGASSLLAMDQWGDDKLLSLPLAHNQTLMEFQNWFAIVLAGIQRRLSLRPFHRVVPGNAPFIRQTGLQELCHRQKVRDADFTSISVLGLSIILSVGGAIIIISLFLAPLVGVLQGWFGKHPYSRHEWNVGELLHIQCTAFESNGIGTWKSNQTTVPVTLMGEKFQLPNISPSGVQHAIDERSVKQVAGAQYTAIPAGEDIAISPRQEIASSDTSNRLLRDELQEPGTIGIDTAASDNGAPNGAAA